MAAPASASLRDLWPFGRKEAEEPVPDPLPYTVAFNVEGASRRVEKALSRASSLVERRRSPPSGLTGLIARARQDVGRLTAVLYENALYAGQVSILIDGKPLDVIGPFDTVSTHPVEVVAEINTRRPFVFGTVHAAPLPRDVSPAHWGLIPGAEAGSRVVLQAEAGLVDAWHQRGHPLARAGPRDTVADHRSHTLDVALNLEPGPLAHFGRVEVVGTEYVDPGLVVGRANLGDGLYSSKVTKNAETRLRDLGVFESVRITPAEALDPDGTIPITITVTERKRRVIGGNVSYSNSEGFGTGIYWRHRNLFGGAERLELGASVSRFLSDALDPDFRVTGKFIKPAIFDPMTDFTLRVEGYRETTEAYRVTAVETEIGLAHIFSDTVSGTLAVELARTRTKDDKERSDDHFLLSVPAALVWDTRDDRLDPSRGIHAQLLAEPAHDFFKGTTFATLGVDLAAYRAFGPTDRFVLAGRVATSILTVDDVFDVPVDKRMYLGGATTVRGYGYKNIAPRDEDGDIIGGRSSILFSGEARYRLTEQFGVVGFVDVGSVSSAILPEFEDIKVGMGAGVRYLTPVGPVRLDVAVPLQRGSGDPAVGIYVGLGQAF